MAGRHAHSSPAVVKDWFDAPGGRPALISDAQIWTAMECRTAVKRLIEVAQDHLPSLDGGGFRRIVVYGGTNGTTCLAWLAAQYSGAIVTVLDDRLPRQWSADFVRRISPQMLLCDAALEDRATEDGPDLPRLRYDDVLHETLQSIRAGHTADLGSLDSMTGPAATIYSSGSTGATKEVLLSHESLRGIAALEEVWGSPKDDDVVALLHPLSMLSGANVLTGAWRRGRTVVTYDLHRDGLDGLGQLLVKHRVTDLLGQTAVIRAVFQNTDLRNSSLRRVAVGGEPVRPVDLELFERTAPANSSLRIVYGMSECPLVASTVIDVGNSSSLNLRFRCHSDTQIMLLDDDGRSVAGDGSGELLATSPRIADGYLQDGNVVTDRFVDTAGTRWFRTGDSARRLPDGSFELCGRIDSRLKIRGYNVYPEAVEAALGSLPEVRESIVVGSERPGGGTMLTAFVIAASAPPPSTGELRRALRAALPDYCVPSAFVISDHLPTLPNGKRDRSLLRTRAAELRYDLRSGDAPRTARERTVERIVADLLGLDAVGINDDLLDLGMDSLMLAELAARSAPSEARTVAVSTLVGTPTIAAIAAMAPSQAATPRLVGLDGGSGPLRIVLVPGAGSAIAYLRALGSKLSPDGEVLAYIAGDELSIRGEARELVSSLAALETQNRPIVIIGHSWGGLVAHEAARQLQTRRSPVRLVVLLDSAAPPRVRRSTVFVRRMARAVHRDTSTPNIVANDRASASMIGDRRFFASIATAGRHRARRADLDALLIQGRDSGTTIDCDRWRQLVSSLAVTYVAGSHASLLVEPFVTEVARTIRDHIAQK